MNELRDVAIPRFDGMRIYNYVASNESNTHAYGDSNEIS